MMWFGNKRFQVYTKDRGCQFELSRQSHTKQHVVFGCKCLGGLVRSNGFRSVLCAESVDVSS